MPAPTDSISLKEYNTQTIYKHLKIEIEKKVAP